MVVKMMKWAPWPPSSSKKFEAVLSIKSIVGLNLGRFCEPENNLFFVEVQWKGQQKGIALGSLRRSTKKNLTRECFVCENGVVSFDDEEFRNVCGFSGPKEGLLYPWEIVFTVFNCLNQGMKTKTTVLGSASLNLAEYASVSVSDGKEFSFKLPLNVPGFTSGARPLLNISLTVLELRAGQELSGTVHGSRTPSPLSSLSLGTPSPPKDEQSALKAGLTKVKTFKGFLSSRRSKKTAREEDVSDCKSSVTSDDGGPSSGPLAPDSLDGDDMAGTGSGSDSGFDRSVSYESLVNANCARVSFYGDERLVYYSNRRAGEFSDETTTTAAAAVVERRRDSKRGGILPWKRRKVEKGRGEPLLKKHYGEDGGDDIDHDRRQLGGWDVGPAREESSSSSVSGGFGDEGFSVGRWERREIASRDGAMKLDAEVFFASIDQRSERAAGESACTALVAVVADWLQSNGDEIPVRSEFDGLIRDGSSEWRRLCEDEIYSAKFPDKHFDLETVLEAGIRPLAVSPEKSFVGFFRPDGAEELGFLDGAMSFDGVWDEMSRCRSPCNYIVSWNDHFFVLKVRSDAYYIIDTLGERLFEGCKEAYVLRFDEGTAIKRLLRKDENTPGDSRSAEESEKSDEKEKEKEKEVEEEEEEVVCRGKECCKEYIKSFLAAIPIRELQADLKKRGSSTIAHHRLQIEFHYTVPLRLAAESPAPMDIDVS